jgi:exodeoxyribonuclease VII small subunit
MTGSHDETSGTDPDGLASMGYAEAIAELDEILRALDRDAVDVDDVAHQVRRAALLIRHCRQRIARVRSEVELIVVELEELAQPEPAASRLVDPDGSDEPGDRSEAGREDLAGSHAPDDPADR